jgi:penicillin-binding protein A
VNRELKRVTFLIFSMFFSLLLAATLIQFLNADTLMADGRNPRSLYDSYKTQRGSILANGKLIAWSVKTDDKYQYLREYDNEAYSAVTGFYSLSQGTTGIENSLDSYLTGKNSSQFFEQINSLLSGSPMAGASAYLTIDPKVQEVAYQALGNLTGAVVAIEPSTGKILAMVSTPSFNANLLAVHNTSVASANYQKLLNHNASPLLNRAIGDDLYAPGSVFKIIVASAAFETGQYKPSTLLPNPKKFKLPGTSTFIYNSGEGKCGGSKTKVSIADALRFSCNIPFAELGLKLGQDVIAAQAERFGFGKSFSLPMKSTPSEYPKNMDDAQTALSSFGQFDDKASPLQMAMVSAAIANGGIMMQPTLVNSILSPNLSVLSSFGSKTIGPAVSETTANEVKNMMVAAVSKGVSSNGRIPGVRVAGKTGTAQNGPGQPYTLWFTGFAPAENPQVAVAVVVANGGGMGQRGFGNLLAAPIARKVMKAVLDK